MSDTFSADSKSASGALSAPGAGVTVAAITGLQANADYRVVIHTSMSGTIDTTNIQNLRLTSGGATLLDHIPSVAGVLPTVIDALHVPSTDLTLIAVGAFGAASIIAASIVATRVG